MNEYTLMCAIRKALAERLAELPLAVPVKSGQPEITRAAGVHIGNLPPKVGDGPDQEFPFVLLQAKSGHFTGAESVVRVLIRCGVYNREPNDNSEAAENDLSNLAAFIRRLLFPYSQEPLESRYTLESDGKGQFLYWERPDDPQPQPFAECWIVSIWRLPG